MKKIIVIIGLTLLICPQLLLAQESRDTIPEFNERLLRQRLIEEKVPENEIEGIIEFKREEFEGLKNRTWNRVVRPNLDTLDNQPCRNEDFEYGSLAGWNGFTGCNSSYSSCSGGCCPTSGIVNGRHAIVSSGTDQFGGFPRVFPGGNHSVRLGNKSAGGQAESLTKSFVVTNLNKIFTYHYAVVLNDPGHTKEKQPFFEIVMLDENGGVIPCSFYKVVSGQGIPGFQSNGSWVYKDWSSNVVDLTNYIGQTVTIRFTTYDCGLGGHAGYAYIDATCSQDQITISEESCTNEVVTFSSSSTGVYDNEELTWDFGDGSPTSSATSPTHIYTAPGIYTVTLSISYPDQPGCDRFFSEEFEIEFCGCQECPSSFAPIPGEKYVLSAWVKEANVAGATTYDGPAIRLDFNPVGSTPLIKGTGKIIDGWQRIEQEFTVPIGTNEIAVKLFNTGTNEIFMDDIRVHPFSASMKSFVYDPVSLRLMAELDERNYATFYEYDEEGTLIRVKKETARGIETIQHSFNATQKLKSNQ